MYHAFSQRKKKSKLNSLPTKENFKNNFSLCNLKCEKSLKIFDLTAINHKLNSTQILLIQNFFLIKVNQIIH